VISVEHEFARKEIDELTEIAKIYKAKGLVALKSSRMRDQENCVLTGQQQAFIDGSSDEYPSNYRR